MRVGHRHHRRHPPTRPPIRSPRPTTLGLGQQDRRRPGRRDGQADNSGRRCRVGSGIIVIGRRRRRRVLRRRRRGCSCRPGRQQRRHPVSKAAPHRHDVDHRGPYRPGHLLVVRAGPRGRRRAAPGIALHPLPCAGRARRADHRTPRRTDRHLRRRTQVAAAASLAPRGLHQRGTHPVGCRGPQPRARPRPPGVSGGVRHDRRRRAHRPESCSVSTDPH